MAITVDKQGKFEALDCVAPLCALALSPAVADDSDPDAPPPDASAVRDAVGALKNLAEWPQARKQIAKIFRREGADKLLVEGPNGDAVPSSTARSPTEACGPNPSASSTRTSRRAALPRRRRSQCARAGATPRLSPPRVSSASPVWPVRVRKKRLFA